MTPAELALKCFEDAVQGSFGTVLAYTSQEGGQVGAVDRLRRAVKRARDMAKELETILSEEMEK